MNPYDFWPEFEMEELYAQRDKEAFSNHLRVSPRRTTGQDHRPQGRAVAQIAEEGVLR